MWRVHISVVDRQTIMLLFRFDRIQSDPHFFLFVRHKYIKHTRKWGKK